MSKARSWSPSFDAMHQVLVIHWQVGCCSIHISFCPLFIVRIR